jgi:hypothetical protein
MKLKTKKLKSDEITFSAFREALDLTPGRLTQLIAMGLPVTGDGHLIPLEAARNWYQNHIRGSARKRGPKSMPKKIQIQKTDEGAAGRLLTAQADKAETLATVARLELRRRQGELLEVVDVEREWGRLLTAARNRMLQLPGKLAPRVLTSTSIVEVQELIRKEIYAVLTALSQDPFGKE